MNVDGIPSVMTQGPMAAGLDDAVVPGRVAPGSSGRDRLPTSATDPAAEAGSLEAAFAPVTAQTLVVGFTSDWLFPPEQNRAIATALLRAGKRATYAELATDLGHDSFLLESPQLYGLIRDFLATG
jgi:hypothetical protein